jgi:exonuclease III
MLILHPATEKTLMDLRAQTDPNTVIVGDLNTPLSPIGRSSGKKINKETSELLHTLDQIDVVDIYRVLHPTTRQYTIFLQLMELTPKEIIF